jgi:hypothetical protein
MNRNPGRGEKFKEHLYEALVFALGRLLAQYEPFAQEFFIEQIGKDIHEYLNRQGYAISQMFHAEDPFSLVDFFVQHGAVDSSESEEGEEGRRLTWHGLYGYHAYRDLTDHSADPSLSCPIHALVRHGASRQGRRIRLVDRSFDERTRTMVWVAQITTQTDESRNAADWASRPGERRLPPPVLSDARLIELAERRARKLEHILEELKTLQGLLPICVHCKKIRNDRGYWQRLEQYLEEHSEAKFSHGLCPDCFKELYPDLDEQS